MGDRTQQHELVVFAFDLLHHDGDDVRPLPLIERRLQLTELVARSDVRCQHMVQAIDDGLKLLEWQSDTGWRASYRSARFRLFRRPYPEVTYGFALREGGVGAGAAGSSAAGQRTARP
jgi:hypothetical protein